MNVVDIIANYLRDNRRLVVPSFGAFVVKESGVILFSELLKTDDGVLRGLLAEGGLSELECAVLIDRFIFDARNNLSENGHFDIGGLGRLTMGADGEIKFVSLQSRIPPVEPVAEKPAEPKPEPAEKIVDATPKPQPERPKPEMPKRRKPAPKKRGVDWFVIVAVAVLLAAVAVIVYGYFCSAEQDDELMMDSLRWQMEQPASETK